MTEIEYRLRGERLYTQDEVDTLRTYLMVHLGTVRQVRGHRDYMSTACPGRHLYDRLGEIIA